MPLSLPLPTMRRPSAPRQLTLLTLLALATAGCGSSHPAAPPADSRAPLAVQTAPVVKTQLHDTIDAGGIVQARTTATVSARLLATISDIRVQPGDRVRRGQTLVVLDGRDLGAAARQATTARTAQDEGLGAARADLDAARAGQALAKASFDRVAALAARKAATAQELDAATSARASADSRVTSSEARVRQAEAALASAGAASDQAGVMASFATLSAPFDGVVIEKLADVGTMAAPGLPILRIEDRSRFTLDIRMDEARAAGLANGTEVSVSLDMPDGSVRAVASRVVEFARGIDSGTRTVVVKLGLPGDAGLSSGVFGRAHLPGARQGRPADSRRRGGAPRADDQRLRGRWRIRPPAPRDPRARRGHRRLGAARSRRRPRRQRARGRASLVEPRRWPSRHDDRVGAGRCAMTERLGAAGKLAAAFIESKLTPLFILASLALGAMAVVGLPREEEPQIVVPMVDVFVAMPGASPAEVEQRVTRPVEQLLWEVPGVEYIYSTSSPGQAMVIVRFHVGQNEEDALVRLNQKLQANLDRIPPGASPPLVKPRSIDDVPILAFTLWSPRYDDHTLRRLATQIDDAIKEVPDVSEVTIMGGRPRQMRVDLNPAQLSAYGSIRCR